MALKQKLLRLRVRLVRRWSTLEPQEQIAGVQLGSGLDQDFRDHAGFSA
jgi:hypothetical protein